MGVTTSKELAYGMPSNPRVDFAKNCSREENKIVRIDAPALVNLPHATLRYRYAESSTKHSPEKPFEGTQLGEKYNYFLHHKSNSTGDPDNQWKSCYVYKGPERARQKQIYYVFGKGMKVDEKGFVESSYKPEEQSFGRPIFYKTHGHLYVDLIFLNNEKKEGTEDAEEDPNHNCKASSEVFSALSSPDPEEKFDDMEMCLPVNAKILDIQVRLARKFTKLAAQIHIYHHGTELRSDLKLKNLIQVEKRQKELLFLLHNK